jgi:hypothetical protein
MNRIFCNLTVVAGLSLGTLAHGAPVTWSFGSNPAVQYSTGQSFNCTGSTACSGAGMPIIVYADQVSATTPAAAPNSTTKVTGGALQTPLGDSGGVVDGLFATSSAVESGFETGIAPYNPQDNTWPYNNQGGTYNNQDGITPTNILELNISGVAKGASLAFVLQGPSGDDVTVYTGDVSSQTSLSGLTVFDNSANNPIGNGVISPTGTTTDFTIVRDSSASEFVAIQADCHYLLLDTITDTPAPTPEPRLYAFLLVGLLAIPAIRRRFVPQQ